MPEYADEHIPRPAKTPSIPPSARQGAIVSGSVVAVISALVALLEALGVTHITRPAPAPMVDPQLDRERDKERGAIKTDVEVTKTRIGRVEEDIGELKQSTKEVNSKVDGLGLQLNQLHDEIRSLPRRMQREHDR